MKSRIFIIYILLLSSCYENNNICFKEVDIKEVENSSLFYVNDIVDNCEYKIKFTCSKNDSYGKLRFDGETYFISFRPKDNYTKLFSNKDSLEMTKTLSVYSTCLQIEKEQFTFRLINKLYRKEDIVLRIRIDSIFLDKELGFLDYNFFLSSKFGLLGNYFSTPELKKVILQENGDLVKDAIDYSGYKFRRIK